MDTPEVKTVNSTESNENRKKRSSKSSKRQSGAAALTIAPLDRDGVLAVAGASFVPLCDAIISERASENI
jgi:hypothetical protein